MKKSNKSKKNLSNFSNNDSNINLHDIDIEDIYKKIKIGSFSDYNWALENYRKFRDISREQELKIIYDAQKGRTEAKIILISLVFPYIIKIYKLVSSKNDYFDSISDGITAALEAIQKYDLKRYNVRFATYASYWIYHSLMKSNYQDTTIKVPLSIYSEYSKFVKAYNEYIHKNNRTSSFEELIEYIFGQEVKDKILKENPGLTIQDDIFKKLYKAKISELKDKYSKIASFMSLRSEISLQGFKFAESTKTIEEFIEDNLFNEPDVDFAQKTIKETLIKSIMNYLDNEEKVIMIEYYGLIDGNGKTLEQIVDIIFSVFGKKYSKERIRQKLKIAANKLRKFLPKDIREYLQGG